MLKALNADPPNKLARGASVFLKRPRDDAADDSSLLAVMFRLAKSLGEAIVDDGEGDDDDASISVGSLGSCWDESESDE